MIGAYPEPMSVLLWWLPAVLVAVIAWWRLRPRASRDDKDLDALRKIVQDDS